MGEAKQRRSRLHEGKSSFGWEQQQALAHVTAEHTLALLDGMHRITHGGRSGEGSPFIQGCISGLLQFMAQGAASDEDIRCAINREIDRTLPQIRDAMANGEAQGTA